MDARTEASDRVGGRIALVAAIAIWVAVSAVYLRHRIVQSSDSMNNYVHVWWIARDLWHHGRLPWRMPVLGHGGAYAFPYGFSNWTVAALLWPMFGDWGVTLCTVIGAIGCAVATFVAFPELRHSWWAAAVLANPALVEAPLFGQQAFIWGSALLLLGVACGGANDHWPPRSSSASRRRRTPRSCCPSACCSCSRACHSYQTEAACCVGTRSLAIALPAIILVFASPGYADSTTRDRIVNFIGTLGPRVLVIALPIIFVLAWRTGIRALAPLALVLAVAVNFAFQEPLNVSFQWEALTRVAGTKTLDTYLRSPRFEPGATYRVLRGAGDAKLGLYRVLQAGGRLDSEMFPESMAMRSFDSIAEYEQLLCARHVDYVVAFRSYTRSRRTNELAVLADIAASPGGTGAQLVALQPIEQRADHVVYRVTWERCPKP